VFDKLQATLAHALMSIGAIKGIEFGEGFGHTKLKGSESNDVPYYDEASGRVRFKTNRAGGILAEFPTARISESELRLSRRLLFQYLRKQ